MSKLLPVEVTKENDIKYSAPLSYRWFRIIGWLSIAASQASMLLSFYSKIIGEGAQSEGASIASLILSLFGVLSLPLFLLANFSQILNNRDSYKSIIIKYAGMAFGFISIFLFIYLRYGIPIAKILGFSDPTSITNGMMGVFKKIMEQNVFLDLFIYTITLYFLDYVPKKHFKGKNLKWFRLLVLIPILYVIFSIVLRRLLYFNDKVPVVLAVFIPSKPVMIYVFFLSLVLHMKRIEKSFIKAGKTKDDFDEYLKTNHGSRNLSKFTSRSLLLVGLSDVIIYAVIYIIFMRAEREPAKTFFDWFKNGTTLGDSGLVLFVIPFVAFFSYNKTYENTKYDSLIPIGGIILIILTYLEGVYWIIYGIMQNSLNNTDTESAETTASIIMNKDYILTLLKTITLKSSVYKLV